jgi:hypothetical protein
LLESAYLIFFYLAYWFASDISVSREKSNQPYFVDACWNDILAELY